MSEKPVPITQLFPYLSNEKAKIVATDLVFIEATHGCSCACRICFLPAPVKVQQYIPSQTLMAIHDFVGKHDPNGTKFISHHNAGQLSDYFDPDTNWDMADVIRDCLEKTRRTVAVYLHGIVEDDNRAIEAAKKLWDLPANLRERVDITVSTDPFGPVNVPVDQAEQIGRARVSNVLQIFQGWSRMNLRIFTPDMAQAAYEEQRVRDMFGTFIPAKVDVMRILKPTRVELPGVIEQAYFEDCNGYGIMSDGTVVFKHFRGPFGWPKIGTLASVDPNKIRPASGMII